MIDDRDELSEPYARNLAADVYPPACELPGMPVFRRKWVLRVSAHLPEGNTIEAAARSFELSARQEISNVLGVPSKVERPLLSVCAIRCANANLRALPEIDGVPRVSFRCSHVCDSATRTFARVH